MAKFTKDSGKFISLSDGAKLTKEYRIDQTERKKHVDPIMSQFFGLDRINQLLSQEGATGLRIYYGLDVDGDGKRDKAFVLTATDANGNDILPAASRGLAKDAAPEHSGVLLSELKCPFDCPKEPNPLESDTQETKG